MLKYGNDAIDSAHGAPSGFERSVGSSPLFDGNALFDCFLKPSNPQNIIQVSGVAPCVFNIFKAPLVMFGFNDVLYKRIIHHNSVFIFHNSWEWSGGLNC